MRVVSSVRNDCNLRALHCRVMSIVAMGSARLTRRRYPPHDRRSGHPSDRCPRSLRQVFPINTLHLEHFHLVLHDIGGPIGFEVANAVPERVQSMTPLNTIVEVEMLPPALADGALCASRHWGGLAWRLSYARSLHINHASRGLEPKRSECRTRVLAATVVR